MSEFIHKDFLLSTKAARKLYHDYADGEPICDYHCHLSPQEVANDKRWDNIGEMWLGGDHYKWRAMRACGIPESSITGKETTWKQKFDAYAKTLPNALRNPLYHWSHLELKRYFDIDTLLSPKTADKIWKEANERLQSPEFSAQNVLRKFDVRYVGTTDDPIDSLEYHKQFAASGHPTRMVPTFRPDKATKLANLSAWNQWVEALAARANQEIQSLGDLLAALKQRHDFFHDMGARLSDHGLDVMPGIDCTEAEAEAIFAKARKGSAVSEKEEEQFGFFILRYVGQLNAAKGWTMQLHLAALRNTNARMMEKLGPDTGYDSLDDVPVARQVARFMDSLSSTNELPKTILYTVNPSQFYSLAVLMGNFQDGTVEGKIQLGSGWWHMDTLDGMTKQIDTLSSVGLLSPFVGMLTDSRSFLSYPRHEYFRRLLCEILGQDIEKGLVPADYDLVGDMVRRICYSNATNYFGLKA
ncbi:MAG: glucuronate isomerase [Verrucomicrobiota bacterium JB022]|nr:glucuronate isomerase [Verrucomicrobiota bacterium JB022]